MSEKDITSLKVAIVCDWLVGIGGAERVVLELHKMFPKAPIYTSQYDSKKIDWFKDADVRTTWLQRLPSSFKKFFPLLRAWSFRRLDLSNYDLVISASGAEAKGVKTGSNTTHICYCFAPTHYYWSRYDEYKKHPGFGKLNWLARIGLKVLVGPLRRWDKKAAGRPDHMVSISTHIQKEIKKYYSRDSVIIHPPVDTERLRLKTTLKGNGFLALGRQTPYKRFDLAVSACSKLNLPLTVVGDGPEHKKLVQMAGPTVTFVADASDSATTSYFQAAEAFIFPGLDDFGITPVEALASGTPVIAFRGGGALDYIKPGENGEFFDKQNVESLIQALRRFNPQKYSADDIKTTAKVFSNNNFRQNLQTYIKDAVQ